eukprot:1334201-Rhodomonas_salina.1
MQGRQAAAEPEHAVTLLLLPAPDRRGLVQRTSVAQVPSWTPSTCRADCALAPIVPHEARGAAAQDSTARRSFVGRTWIALVITRAKLATGAREAWIAERSRRTADDGGREAARDGRTPAAETLCVVDHHALLEEELVRELCHIAPGHKHGHLDAAGDHRLCHALASVA